MKRFIVENKKSLFFFFSSVVVAFLVAGVILYVNHEKELEKTKIELKEQKAKAKKKLTEKKEQEKKKAEENNAEKEQEVIPEETDSSTQNNISSSNSLPHVNTNTNTNMDNVPGTENDVIAYFSEQERYASGSEQDASIRERLKSGVNTIYQFLFHGGTIRGKTFRELSSSAKLQVLKLALSIDSKIDSYFPNYKQSIKQGASNLKAKIVITYLETTNKICSNYENVCSQAREDFKTMKNSFKISFSLIAGLAKEGGAAIKEWYLSTK